MAGLSAAWHLARRGVREIVIVDERPPLSLTSDKSTECYRNWWPDAPTIGLMNRSIDQLDELAARPGNPIALNRNGYLFLTATAEGAARLERVARENSTAGASELRVHGVSSNPGTPEYREPDWDRPEPASAGADLFFDPAEIRRRFPWVAPDTRAALHTRRCGWLSAQQLGMLWLEEARAAGAKLIEGTVVGVELDADRVVAVRVAVGVGIETIACESFVNAAGPFVDDVARLVGERVPVFHELHCKVVFDDRLGAVPREAPLVIWDDLVELDWSDEERAELAQDPAAAPFLGPMPGGIHFRPEGGRGSRAALLLWTFHTEPTERLFPIPEDPLLVPVVVRGMARLLPAFAPYAAGGPRPFVDGGYYTKTRENRPLIGPLGPRGSFLLGALSGFGVMASPAAGELLAAHLTGGALPSWAPAFRLERYADPAYVRSLAELGAGQL